MEAIVFGLGFVVLAAAALFVSADSRPRIEDSHTRRREPWFPRP